MVYAFRAYLSHDCFEWRNKQQPRSKYEWFDGRADGAF